MRAALRINALIRQPEPFHRPTVDQVLLDDLRGIFRLHVPIPDGLGIYDHGGAMFALIEAAGLVDPHRIHKTGSLRKLLKLRVQFALAVCSARRPRRALRADIMANKNMMFENRQIEPPSPDYRSAALDRLSKAPRATFHILLLAAWPHLRE